MAFRAQDLRKTVRREGGRELRRLYPRLLRDESVTPKVGIAIRFFETKLGLARHELDSEALAQLFGDPKLARCLIGCLARAYRYRARRFAEVVGRERAATLAARGLASARDLRALAYERANRDCGGFVGPQERARFLDGLAPELDLVEAEQLLWLDAPDQAILTRVGPTPTAAETLALYNLRVLETLLRNAPAARLRLRGDAATVEAVCARHGVRATVEGTTVSLWGRQDALGSWARHGARVARAALTLLGDGALGAGECEVRLGDELFRVALDAATLRDALPPRGWSAPGATWPASEALVGGLVGERRAGRLAGWRLKRWPEPLVTEAGALWPEYAIARGTIAIGLLPLPARRLRADAAALRALAARLPFIVLVAGAYDPHAVPDDLTVLPLDGEDAAANLASYLERTFPTEAGGATPEWLTALTAAARAAGSLAESELARRLDCAEELVAGRLAALDEAAAGVVYLDGFGLCADGFLDRARGVLDEEMARNGGRLDLGTVGRRLRALAGRNEGLHALIAHLSGELRPAA
jgi:predicted nuclease of restriction endonuclease-like RecB superfamily